MPRTRGERLIITEGSGAWLTTSTGQRLLDATAGLWHTNVGHGRERIARAAYDQMCQLETYHLFGRFANQPAMVLADRLAQLGPIPEAKVMFTSGGSDSIDTACKLARRHWQLEGRTSKRIILSRRNSYHGLHAYGTSIAGLEYNREGYGADSLIPESARVATNDLQAVAAEIDRIGADNIAAFVLEPVLGTGGVVGPSDGYLRGVSRICRDLEILLVADEVITGFGRAGTMFASERYGLEPDLVTFAKGVTSGYAPLGGILAAPRVAGRFFEDRPDEEPLIFRHGLTYSGHATACVVATTNLDILEEEGLVQRSAILERTLEALVEPLKDHPLVHEVRAGAAFMAGLQLVAGVSAEDVANACIERGVLTRQIHDNTLQISPPFVITEDELSHLVDVITTTLNSVRK
jgi:adenosylmethionine-8-amino-7-oxononanoate aminotransferase